MSVTKVSDLNSVNSLSQSLEGLGKVEALQLLEQKIRVCADCGLCKGRKNAVPGFGDYQAKLMFIGEGPGRDEDIQGRPFVGAAGKYLTKMLEDIGIKREQVFITNVVKCRPPNNRDPLPEEAEACFKYLDAQLKLIRPLLLITLGRHSMARFLPGFRISEIHGQAKRVSGIFTEKQVIFPLYHPAAALYNPNLRATLEADMRKLPALIKKIEEQQLL
jgi:DNA polymerase